MVDKTKALFNIIIIIIQEISKTMNDTMYEQFSNTILLTLELNDHRQWKRVVSLHHAIANHKFIMLVCN